MLRRQACVIGPIGASCLYIDPESTASLVGRQLRRTRARRMSASQVCKVCTVKAKRRGSNDEDEGEIELRTVKAQMVARGARRRRSRATTGALGRPWRAPPPLPSYPLIYIHGYLIGTSHSARCHPGIFVNHWNAAEHHQQDLLSDNLSVGAGHLPSLGQGAVKVGNARIWHVDGYRERSDLDVS